MKSWCVICAAVLIGVSACAQSFDVLTVRSRTEQFVVHGTASSFRASQPFHSARTGQGQFFWFQPYQLKTNEISRIRLVPGLVAVSCERIKEALLNALEVKDAGGRRIHIYLNSQIAADQIAVAASRSTKGWIYGLELPMELDERQFASVILQVLLLEMVNHESTEQYIELPFWLLNGLIAHLQATSLQSLALQPNLQLATVQTEIDPVARLRQRFQNELPLTFDELSWPENLATTNKANLFQDSAQLFVHELLRLENGKACLRRFLEELPKYKNWQFAFLGGFKPHFAQLVDAEKWWALRHATFVGRDLKHLWSPDESWRKLKETLDVSAQIRLKSNRLPVEAKITLQEVIDQWDRGRQEITLRKALGQLRAMRQRVQPELVSLVDDYGRVLETYLEERNGKGQTPRESNFLPSPVTLKKSICRQLDVLDEKRSKLYQTVTLSKAK